MDKPERKCVLKNFRVLYSKYLEVLYLFVWQSFIVTKHRHIIGGGSKTLIA